jgi:hypothetical protein
MITHQLIVAVLSGAFTIGILSFLDFHRPYGVAAIRYAVLPERYCFALAVYIAGALILYVMTLNILVQSFFVKLWEEALGGSLFREEALRESSLLERALRGSLLVGVPVTVCILAIGPYLPGIAPIVDRLRSIMWLIARYPESVETMAALIARSPFTVSVKAREEIVDELQRYGVSAESIEAALRHDNKTLASSAATMLQEVCSLYGCLGEIEKDRRFRRFFEARQGCIEELEKEYRRLMRRAARALLLSEDLSLSEQASADVALEISDFVAEEGERLLRQYQRLLAEASLSCVSNPAARTKLISSFGYRISLPKALPIVPLIVVFVLDFIISTAPVLLLPMPKDVTLPALSTAMLATSHASALTMSLFLAVYPKMITNFARPSFTALPWSSYAVFGLLSYVFGNAITYMTLRVIELPQAWIAKTYPFVGSSLFATVFFITTVTMSVLLDSRLRDPSTDYQRGRFRDGAAFGIVLVAAFIVLQIAMIAVGGGLHLTIPVFPWYLRILFTGLFGLLGFVIGYLVPSTAEAHIEATKTLLSSVATAGNLPGWSTQVPAPAATTRAGS